MGLKDSQFKWRIFLKAFPLFSSWDNLYGLEVGNSILGIISLQCSAHHFVDP